MSIKVFCDCCGLEPQGNDFTCEMTVQEVVCDLSDQLPVPNKRLVKKMLQICKDCYREKIANLFNAEKK